MSGITDTLVHVVPGDEASTCQFCPVTVDEEGRVFATFKTRFGRHAVGFGPEETTWLAPKVAEGTATVFYVFDSAGDFRYSIEVDDYLTGFKIRGRTLLGIGETPFGEPVVRVYEIR